ncbi:MAG: S9 family peptidase [Acidobacteriaceae bacterium]|nr:S9 family peptidase [Acidobacteriaceae bacterium]
MRRCSFVLFVSLLLADSERPPVAEILQELDRTVTYNDVAISPDGKRIAWAQGTAGSEVAILHVLRRSGGPDHEVQIESRAASREDTTPAWSPDSKRLVFISNSGPEGAPELWLLSGDQESPRKLASLKGYAARPRWSPDGTKVALLYVEGAAGGGPLMAAGAQTGVIDNAFHNQRIAIVDAASGAVGMGSPADRHVYDFDWSPDGKHFVATAAPGPGDNNWWIAELYVVDADNGTAHSIYKPKLQIAVPRWSPDGARIAFIEGLMSDEGFHGGDLFTVDSNGRMLKNHTPGRKTSPSSLVWDTPDELLFSEYSGGGVNLSTLNVKSGVIEMRWKAEEEARTAGNFPNMSVAPAAKQAALIRSSFETPPEIWAGPIGEWKQLTHNNDGVKPRWKNATQLEAGGDGYRVQAWLIPPLNPGPGKHPLVVSVHGGPSSVVTPSWPAHNSTIALLAASGYYVLLPNPRGSYGQGEAFTRANVKDFGYGDLRDILAAVDAAVAKYPVDAQRVGITGWSYGGYMTMFAVTQTQRFKAAVAGAGIANWTSYYGENLIDRWMIPFFGASVYDAPTVYAKSSPINFIKRVKTPTLVVVGEQDAECPAPQSFEFWHALKTLGVPTELVVYPGEGHMFMKPEHKRDEQERLLAWFDKYLR